MTNTLVSTVIQRLRLIGWGRAAAGAVATFTTVGLLFPALGGSVRVNTTSGWVNAPVIIAVVIGAGFMQARVRGRHVADALRWLIEKCPPDEREHAARSATWRRCSWISSDRPRWRSRCRRPRSCES